MAAFALAPPHPRLQARSARCMLSQRRRHGAGSARAALDAVIFDCDGVLSQTEKDGHRVAFNMAFEERGLGVVWDEALYGRLLETGGGKERMSAYWNGLGKWPEGFDSVAERNYLVRSLHKRKTEIFMDLVADGGLPLREGVQRLVDEARDADVPIVVCSTSNEKAVRKIVDLLGEARAKSIPVLAGDVVEAKKPSPDIYLLAVDNLSLDPAKVVVIEDSFIGLKAARAAGMVCVITKSSYTQDEDFADAQMVLDSLESPAVSLADLTNLVEGAASTKPKPFIRMRRRFGPSYL